MKLAEAITLVGELRDELNLIKSADLRLHKKEDDSVLPFEQGLEKYLDTLSRITWYKTKIAEANEKRLSSLEAAPRTFLGGAGATINSLRATIDSTREIVALLKENYSRARTTPELVSYDYEGGERVKIVQKLNGIEATKLKALLDNEKKVLKMMESLLAKINWQVEIDEYPN